MTGKRCRGPEAVQAVGDVTWLCGAGRCCATFQVWDGGGGASLCAPTKRILEGGPRESIRRIAARAGLGATRKDGRRRRGKNCPVNMARRPWDSPRKGSTTKVGVNGYPRGCCVDSSGAGVNASFQV